MGGAVEPLAADLGAESDVLGDMFLAVSERRWVTFDWRQPVSGYLNLLFFREAEARALVFAGLRPVDPRQADPTTWVVNMEGRRFWFDSRPRTFRYVTVVSTEPLTAPWRSVIHSRSFSWSIR